jgi:hypothetical protein
MSFLKKIGSIILKASQIVGGYGPLVSATVPGSGKVIETLSADLAQIQNIIISMEAAGQALGIAGADKLKAASPLVAQVILQSALLANREIADQALFMKGVTEVGGGVADILNSLKDKVEVVNKA